MSNGRMDKENVVHIPSRIFPIIKKIGLMFFSGKCTQLEVIRLIKVSQPQISYIFSHKWFLDLYMSSHCGSLNVIESHDLIGSSTVRRCAFVEVGIALLGRL